MARKNVAYTRVQTRPPKKRILHRTEYKKRKAKVQACPLKMEVKKSVAHRNVQVK